jgi:hypothetical protein
VRIVADTNILLSGDDDLRSLGAFEGIRIVNAREALGLIGSMPARR